MVKLYDEKDRGLWKYTMYYCPRCRERKKIKLGKRI